jgi:hypothetical protein
MTAAIDAAQVVAATPADTSVQVLILWALALSTLINLATVVWNIFSGPSKRNSAKLDEHSVTLGKIDNRVGALEKQHDALPTREEFHNLDKAMTALNGVINVLSERLKPLEAITERAQEWMLENSRK